ncbi:MAG: hypothetical protein ABIT01_08105 [Thermoanaerobaculia bacterium]
MSAVPNRPFFPAFASGWVANPRWDLTWLCGSALLVLIPPIAHTYWKVGATGIDLLVTLMIGGPHMYATFLRTVLEPRFRQKHPVLAWLPLVVVPTFVILGAVFAFDALLSFFFLWASLHICDQASFVASRYRARTGEPTRFERLLDFSVALSALYVVAIYRFVDGSFVISDHVIWFPPFLKAMWFARLFAFGTAALIAYWAVRSWNQFRRGSLGGPYFLFMILTMGVGIAVPTMKELSVSFQGFNAWHSFQYLGLTFLVLNQRETAGTVTLGFVRALARPGRFFRYYGWNVLLTTGAGFIVAGLTYGMHLPTERCYYAVVLSFLLVHYFHDHLLFSDSTEGVAAQRSSSSLSIG